MEPRRKTALHIFRILFIIIQVLVVIILVVALFIYSYLLRTKSEDAQMLWERVIELQNRVSELQNEIYFNSFNLKEIFYDIYDINVEDQTATVTYYMRLKDSTDVNSITLTTLYGDEVKLKHGDDDLYKGTVTMNIFQEKETTPSITFKRHRTDITENIDWNYFGLPDELYDDIVPSYELTNSHFTCYKSKVDIENITIKDIGKVNFYKLKSAQLMVTRRGEVLDSFDVKPLLTAGGNEFTLEINKSYEYDGTDVQVHLYTETKEGYHVRQYLLFFITSNRDSIPWNKSKLYVMNEDDEILYTNDRYAH